MMVLPVQAVQFSRNFSEMEQSLRKKSLKDESVNSRIEKALTDQKSSPLKKSSTAKLNRPNTKSEAHLEVPQQNFRNQPKLERLLTQSEPSTALVNFHSFLQRLHQEFKSDTPAFSMEEVNQHCVQILAIATNRLSSQQYCEAIIQLSNLVSLTLNVYKQIELAQPRKSTLNFVLQCLIENSDILTKGEVTLQEKISQFK